MSLIRADGWAARFEGIEGDRVVHLLAWQEIGVEVVGLVHDHTGRRVVNAQSLETFLRYEPIPDDRVVGVVPTNAMFGDEEGHPDVYKYWVVTGSGGLLNMTAWPPSSSRSSALPES